MKMCPHFCTCNPILIQFAMRVDKNVLNDREIQENMLIERHNYGCKYISTATFHIWGLGQCSGSGTVLLVRRSQDRFPVVSLGIFFRGSF